MANYDLVEAFLTASAAAADAAAAAERRRDMRERNRLRAGVALLAVATVIAGGAAAVANQERERAQKSSKEVAERAEQLAEANKFARIKTLEAQENARTAGGLAKLARQRALDAEISLQKARQAEARAQHQAAEARRAQLATLEERKARVTAETEIKVVVAARDEAENTITRIGQAVRSGNMDAALVLTQARSDDSGQPPPIEPSATSAEQNAQAVRDFDAGHPVLSDLLQQERPARMTRLPFYHGAELWEVESDASQLKSFLVDREGRVAALTGTGDSIDRFNSVNRPQLDTDKKVTDYVDFLGAHLWGANGEGPLRSIRRQEQLPPSMRALFKPMIVKPPQDGKWRAETLILYGGSLFSADIRVDSGGVFTIAEAREIGHAEPDQRIAYRRDGVRQASQPTAGANTLASLPPAMDADWQVADAGTLERLRNRIRNVPFAPYATARAGNEDPPPPIVLGEGLTSAQLRPILAAYRPARMADPLASANQQASPLLMPGDADALARNFAEANDPERVARVREPYRRMQADFAARLSAVRGGRPPTEESVEQLAGAAMRYSNFAAVMRDKGAVDEIADALDGLIGQAGASLPGRARDRLRAEALAAGAALADLEGRPDDWAQMVAEGRELTSALAEHPDSSPELLLTAGRFARDFLNDDDFERRSAKIEQLCGWAERAIALRPADSRMFRFVGWCSDARIALAEQRRDESAVARLVAAMNERIDRQLALTPNDQTVLAWKIYAIDDMLRGIRDPGERAEIEALRRELLKFVVETYADRPLEHPGSVPLHIFDQLRMLETDDRQAVLTGSLLYRVLAPIALAFPMHRPAAHASAVSAMDVAGPLIARGDEERRQAGAYIGSATAIMDRSDLIGTQTVYSRRLFDQCNVYDELARFHEESADLDQAAAARRRLDSVCRPLAERLPAAVDVRMIFLDSDYRFARLLDRSGRSTEAVPLAESASRGGWRMATLLLADMARNGRGMKRDRARARGLEALAARQDAERIGIAAAPNATGTVSVLLIDDLDQKHHQSLDAQLDSFGQIEGWTINPFLAANLREIQHVARAIGAPFRRLAQFYFDRRNSALPSEGVDLAEFDKAIQRLKPNPRISKSSDGTAIQGFDPVALAEGNARAGSLEAYAVYGDAVWMFENLTHRDMFLANPETYVPAFGGFCAGCLAQNHKLAGSGEFFDRHEGKTYLFANARLLEDWQQQRATRLEAAIQNWEQLKDVTRD